MPNCSLYHSGKTIVMHRDACLVNQYEYIKGVVILNVKYVGLYTTSYVLTTFTLLFCSQRNMSLICRLHCGSTTYGQIDLCTLCGKSEIHMSSVSQR